MPIFFARYPTLAVVVIAVGVLAVAIACRRRGSQDPQPEVFRFSGLRTGRAQGGQGRQAAGKKGVRSLDHAKGSFLEVTPQGYIGRRRGHKRRTGVLHGRFLLERILRQPGVGVPVCVTAAARSADKPRDIGEIHLPAAAVRRVEHDLSA
jgi:hypothetical protein